MKHTTTEPSYLSDILDQLVNSTDGEKVTLGQLLDVMDERAYGPMMLIPAVIGASPIGGIPGATVVTASIIFLVALQMLIASEQPSLPHKLTKFSFSRKILVKNVQRFNPAVQWMEKFIKPRYTFMLTVPFIKGIALICMGLAVITYPVGLIPMAAVIPCLAVALFSLGMTSHDGVLVGIGFALTFASIGILIWVLFFR